MRSKVVVVFKNVKQVLAELRAVPYWKAKHVILDIKENDFIKLQEKVVKDKLTGKTDVVITKEISLTNTLDALEFSAINSTV